MKTYNSGLIGDDYQVGRDKAFNMAHSVILHYLC